MSKELEVWKELIDNINECKKITSYSDEGKREYIGYSKDYSTNEINVGVIESALKEKEQTDMLLEQFGLSNIQNFIDNLKIVAREQKKLKAFDIVNDKICVDFFIGLDNEYVYVLKLKNSKNPIQITKEQYDILKEVLL